MAPPGEGAASPSRAVGATAVSTGGALRNNRGVAHCHRGPATPEGTCGGGPSRTVGRAFHVAWPTEMQGHQERHRALPGRPVSLEIGLQSQIQTPAPDPSSPSL